MRGRLTEREIVLVVAAAQFINVLEFMIVMPLGPDYAAALGFRADLLPFVASAYTWAAAAAGLAGALFLDRIERRRALVLCLGGLVLSTAAAGFAQSFSMLVVLRAVAGLFGGPATSISMSIVADAVPDERRGRAFSTVLLAFSLAAIVGVPAGLELARLAGWRAPFFAIALLGMSAVVASARLPPLAAQRRQRDEAAFVGVRRMLSTPQILRSYAMTCALQMSGFLLIPNLSPFLQRNVGFPRARLALLYLGGGLVSLVSTRLSGRAVDRYGSLPVATLGLAILGPVMVLSFVRPLPVAAVPLAFGAYMFALGMRNVAYNTLVSKVPAADERARFQSLQSTLGHLSISCAATIAGHFLTTGARGELVGMPRLVYLSLAISALLPPLMWRVERDVRTAAPSA